MAVWVGATPWVGSQAWSVADSTTDRNAYLTSVLATDGTNVAVLTGGPQATAALAGDGTSVATLAATPLLTANLTINN